MKKLVVSAHAEEDLRAIARFTERQWGVERKTAYLERIRERLRDIRRNPAAGAPRDHIKPGYRGMPAGSHIIFYRETPKAIEILRILHRNMDMRRRLADDGPDAEE